MIFQQFNHETEEDHKPRSKERFVDACKVVLIIIITVCIVLFFVTLAIRNHNKNHSNNNTNKFSGLNGGINKNNRQNGFGHLAKNDNEIEDNNSEEFNFKIFSHFDLLSPEFTASISTGEFLEILQTVQINDLGSLMLADSKTNQDILKRTQRLIGNLSFKIIDMNKDKIIEKNEWSMFLKEAFPQDYQKYNNLFMEMNQDKPVTAFEYLWFLSSSQFAAVQPPLTPKSTTTTAIEKIILTDTKNYYQTTLTIFNIFAIKNNKVVTKTDAQDVLINLGSDLQRAASTVDQFFKYAENNQFLTNNNEITFKQFQRMAMAMQKSLKIRFLKQQEDQVSNQNISQNFFMDELLTPFTDSILGMFSLKVKSILSVLLNKEVQQMSQQQQNEILNVLKKSIEYQFNILDTNGDQTISAEEFDISAEFLFQNEYDFEIIQKWFKSITQDKQTISKNDFTKTLMERVKNIFFNNNNGQEAMNHQQKYFQLKSLRNIP